MRIDNMVERAILDSVPEVTGVVARTGSDEIGLDPMGLNQTDMFLEIKPRAEWRFKTKEEFIEKLRVVLGDLPWPCVRFYPAHRDACFRNAHRCSWRCSDKIVWR